MSVQVQLRRDTTQNVQANKGQVGEVFVDTTVNRLVVQDNSTPGGWPTPITLSVQSGGNTNDSASGSGTDFDHNLTFAIPANFMIAKRAFRVTAHFQLTTGSAPPSLSYKLKLGSVVLAASAAVAAVANMTNTQLCIQWLFQSMQAPGSAANVQCMAVCALNAIGSAASAGLIQTAMPVAIATNAAQTLKVSTLWSAVGTGTNTIALNQLIVEALN